MLRLFMLEPQFLLANAGYQSNWIEVLGQPFMRNAFIAGSLVAIASGMLGYFVVVREGEFAAHALGHIGFPGATGAVLLGLSPTLGLAVFCVGGALIMHPAKQFTFGGVSRTLLNLNSRNIGIRGSIR